MTGIHRYKVRTLLLEKALLQSAFPEKALGQSAFPEKALR